MLDRKTGRTIVIKTHIRRRTRGTDSFASAIVLIRNPFRAIISHYNFKESSGHQGIADWNITMETSEHLNCDIHLAPNGSLPIVALASCPGSGNTWVRYLLEQATGIYTGSVYHDKRLQRGGLLGEMDEMNSGRTIAIKTHTRTMTSGTELFTSAIVLFRNPFRAVISHYNFKETRDHRGVAKWEANMNTSRHWHNSSKKTMDWWRDVAKFWLTLYEKPILVVHYEDLVNDTVGELTRMLDFLHVPQKERRIDCVRNKLEGGFHRHSNVNQELQFAAFTPEMRSEIKNFTDWTSSILTQRGYKPIYRLKELEV
ncbi:sialate:O-sulfotransferase 1-like [Saccoglossus kowalevskii]|uniref:WSC domain-containing protein 1-like n=1 Tax=Saccoglossus kowalevskii TaxID=10224 RepID=A0ABM0MYV7_SACKO|nr:PREDICTED: WSC domain-containing protein 1-like [Saccoglossus kowalevskii]